MESLGDFQLNEELGRAESLQTLFSAFLRNFRDRKGRFKYRERIREMIIKESKSLLIDYEDIIAYDPHLADLLENSPDDAIRALSDAIRNIVADESPEYLKKVYRFYPRLSGWVKSVPIRHVRSEHINKLIMVEGIIVRATPPRQKLFKAVYQHILPSGESHEFEWPPGEDEEVGEVLEKPSYCPICIRDFEEGDESGGRRGVRGTFKLLPEKSKFRDWQKIVIQEKPEEIPAGQIPRSLEVVLTDDLVDTARPGDRVTIVGVLRLANAGKTVKPIFPVYLDANNVIVAQRFLEELKLSPEDEEKILTLARDPLIRRKIVASIAPAIYGMWDIKEAIALLLFGGVPKTAPDGTKIRGEIHILLLGDPGVGKSQLLQYVSRIAPRGIYTTGKGSSAAGLTAAVVKDKQTGEYFLEAGAMVLGDGGVVAIDEIDKMREEDRVAIHEAMEQGSYHRDFELMLADGRKVRIGEFVDSLIESRRHEVIVGKDTEILPVSDVQVLAYDLNRKEVVIVSADRVSRHKAPSKFIKLKFSNGREILVTPEHPVVVWRDGKFVTLRADQVTAGMMVPAIKHLPLPGASSDDQVLNQLIKDLHASKLEDLAKLIGFLLSDGFTYENSSNSYYEVGFSNTNTDLIKEFKGLLDQMRIHYSEHTTLRGRRRKALITVRVISKDLYNTLKKYFPELFPSGNGVRPSRQKRIPALIFKMPDDAKKAFVNAFFKGDGYVDNYGVGFATSSRKLAEDLQDLLLTLGIRTYIFAEKKEENREYFKVVITGRESLSRIASIVADDPRHHRVEKLLKSSQRELKYRDELPYEVGLTLRKLLSSLRINDGQVYRSPKRRDRIHREIVRKYVELASMKLNGINSALEAKDINILRKFARQTELAKDLGLPYSTLRYRLLKKRDPEVMEALTKKAREKMLQLKEILENLDTLIEGNIVFLTVVDVDVIKNEGTEWVYDVTVEPHHLFISHGLVLHNTVSIAKAGIVARLNARASILAAGNPKRGRYIPSEGLAGNINLPVTILSRFDLIFILKDIAELKKDESLVRYVLRTHEKKGEITPEIPPDLLRKYIAYARKNVKPTLSQEAEDIIREYYIELRKKSAEREDAPLAITTRQLEALIRLAEAHARMALKERVEAEDAAEAVRLMNTVLEKVGMDVETGVLDIDTILVGKPKSMREKEIAVLNLIKELSRESEGLKCVKIKTLRKAAAQEGIDDLSLEKVLRNLRREGDIFERRPGCYAPVEGG
ncbi:MAG: hypothetical protein J7L55_05545 [Desulfurococcales archaeon]|nr:hypothetical protein [Desulfurococcales archaeon]